MVEVIRQVGREIMMAGMYEKGYLGCAIALDALNGPLVFTFCCFRWKERIGST